MAARRLPTCRKANCPATPKSLSPRRIALDARPCGSEGSNQTRRRFDASGIPVFPRLCWPPSPRGVARLSSHAWFERRQSRTGHGRKTSPRRKRRIEAFDPSAAKIRAESPNPTEAEFSQTGRAKIPFGQSVKQTKPSATRRERRQPPSILFRCNIFPKGGDFRDAKSARATIPSPGSWFLNALAPSAKRGDNIFLKLSSGATIKSRRAPSPRGEGGRVGKPQCWATTMVEGSTLTPGPMVEDKAIRCR